MPRDLVTVVIPTRNRWRLLERTLGGALRQEEVDLEIVVVDDGSDDETPDGLAGIVDPRLRVHRNDRATGVAGARNAGIAEARGSWLAFLDDDDLWSPRKLHVQLDAAREQERDWVFGAALVVDEALGVISAEAPPPASVISDRLLTFNAVPGGCSGVMARTELVRSVGAFDSRFRVLADWDLWIRLNRKGPPAVSPGFEMAYVKHPQNMTVTALEGVERELELLVAEHRDAGLAVDDAWFSRWLAGSHRRASRRIPAARTYLAHALRAGDLGSAVRAAATLTGERTMGRVTGFGADPSSDAPDWLGRYHPPRAGAPTSREASTES